MKVNNDNICELSIDTLKIEFSDSFNKVFKRYSYALLTEEEIDKLSADAIRVFKHAEFKDNDIYEKKFESILNETVKEYILVKLKDVNYALHLLKYYIEKNISMPTSLKEAVKNISSIVNFISRIGYSNSFDVCESLVNNDNTVRSNLAYIYNGYKSLIENGRINQILSDKEISLLEVYLVCENIEYEDIDQLSQSLLNNSDGYIDSLKMYMHDMGQIGIPTKEEEETLGELILEGNKAKEMLDDIQNNPKDRDEELVNTLKSRIKKGKTAEDKLVEANLRLAIAISKKYVTKGVDLLDLIQEGNRGLMKAAHLYDVSKGYRFTTYAIWWIKSFVARYVGDNCKNIRIPIHQNETINKIYKLRSEMFIELQRKPTKVELAERLNITVDRLNTILNNDIGEVSLYTKINDDDTAELADFVADEGDSPEEENMTMNLGESVRNLLNNTNLSTKEYEVIVKRYGLDGEKPKTLMTIAQEYGVTRERIRQIEEKALGKLRRNGRTNGLSDFLDSPDKGLETLDHFRKTGIMNRNVKSYTSTDHFYETHQAKKAKSIEDLLGKWDFELVKLTCDDILDESEWDVIEKRYGARDLTERGKNRLSEQDKLTHQKLISHLKRELTKRTFYIENKDESIYDLYPNTPSEIVDYCLSNLAPSKIELLESRNRYYELSDSEKKMLFHLLEHISVSIKGKTVIEKKRIKQELINIRLRLNYILTTEEAVFVISGMAIEEAMIVCLYEGFNTLDRKFTKEEIIDILGIDEFDINEKITSALKEFAELLKKYKNSSLAKRYIKDN